MSCGNPILPLGNMVLKPAGPRAATVRGLGAQAAIRRIYPNGAIRNPHKYPIGAIFSEFIKLPLLADHTPGRCTNSIYNYVLGGFAWGAAWLASGADAATMIGAVMSRFVSSGRVRQRWPRTSAATRISPRRHRRTQAVLRSRSRAPFLSRWLAAASGITTAFS